LREIYNKVINLSYNVLSFYQIYAEGQDLSAAVQSGKPNVLDQWIVSRVNGLIKQATESLEKYDTVRYAKEIRIFADDLSTWWVRRSRERFKSEDAPRCLAALRSTLLIYAKVIAPIMPFLAEHIWQKAKEEHDPDSVHLADWPIYDRESINIILEEDMTLAREIVELGHAQRAEAGIRVRQPLKSIFWNKRFQENQDDFAGIIKDELNVENYSVTKSDDVAALEVHLDTQVDGRLRRLGDLREIHRGIQQIRKMAGYKQTDFVSVNYFSDDVAVKKLVEQNIDAIKKSTNLTRFNFAKLQNDAFAVELSCGKLLIAASS